MTRAEIAILIPSVIVGVLVALAIPEPATTAHSPSNLSQDSGKGPVGGNGASATLRASAGIYGLAVSVTDGDTIRVNGVAVRLWGVDAPESGQTCRDGTGRVWACGAASTASLRGMVESDPAVTCERKDTDRYGRTVAVCRNSAGDLGAMQVARGLAVAYRRYSWGYADHELAAKAEKLGIWAGEFTKPEQWRRENGR